VSNGNMNASRPPDRTITETSDRDRTPAPDLLTLEEHQPDPMLQMTTGRIGAGGVTLVAIVIAGIVGVVFYGLNSGGTEQSATAPAPAHATQPTAGGNSGAATPNAPQANESGAKG
jgi:hypothetical protein